MQQKAVISKIPVFPRQFTQVFQFNAHTLHIFILRQCKIGIRVFEPLPRVHPDKLRKNIAHWHFRCMKLLCSIFSVFICRIFRFFRGHFFRGPSFGGRSFRDILVFLIFFLVFCSTHVKSLRFPQPDIFCFYCKWLSFRPACHSNRAFLSCKNHSIHLGKRVF